jgi:uracil-DNA glycosylase
MATVFTDDSGNIPSTFSLLVDAARDLPEQMLQEELLRLKKIKVILASGKYAAKAGFNPIPDREIENILLQIDNAD